MNEHGIEELIGTLYEMVQDARSVPFSSDKCAVEREKVLDLLDEISNQLPGELKQAKTIVESRNEVITNAKREAENILKQAEQRAKQMISREEITRQAAQQADEMVKAAQQKIKELKQVTNDYVDDAMKRTEDAGEMCGEGLKRVCKLVGIPPVLHMGSCVDISRMMILASDIAKDWGINISQIPLCGCAPEWMSEKAVSIGNYVVATGIDTFLGVDPYVKGSSEICDLLTGEHGVKDWVEANYTVETDIEKLGDLMIERIEQKRAALGI